MKKIKSVLFALVLLMLGSYTTFTFYGCAQIGAPTGGSKDTIPPRLVKAIPQNETTNFSGNKIVLHFDEYVNLVDVQNNVLISPYQSKTPNIDFNFKTVTVKLKDSLLPNTTYTINFGNAIADLNENNPLGNFIYTFSTGPVLDSLSLSGKVTLAETGNTDSTLIVLLYKNLADSAVKTSKPAYITKVKGDGSFIFENLPHAQFNMFALKDGDNSKTYNSKNETFGFLDSTITLDKNIYAINIFAYEEVKTVSPPASTSKSTDKRLRYSTNIIGNKQDILQPLQITFNNAIKTPGNNELQLTDTLYQPIIGKEFSIDSTKKIISLSTKWNYGASYNLIVSKSISDTLNNTLLRSDTIRFTANTKEAYGRAVLRFNNLNIENNPILQLVQGEKIMFSFPLATNVWKNDLLLPGEYDIRIVYDANKNSVWDPGNYDRKLQPEKATTLKMKLAIKADWDNERDINL